MKNLVLNLRTAKAQAGCAKLKDTSLSFRRGLGRGFLFTFLLLTLGVGQMWATTVTVKFKVTGWTKVYAYTWDGDSNGDWPGGEITSSLSNGWYSYNLTSGAKIIFNNNNGKQTNNIENVTEDVCYIWVDDTKKEKKDVNCDGTIDGSDVEYFYRGTSNEWGATKMTQHALGLYSYIGPYSQNDKFKIALSTGGWDYGWDSNVHDLTFNGGVASGLVRDEGNYKISPSGSYYIMVYHPNTSLNNTSSVKINIRSSLYNPSYDITYKDEGNVTYTGSNGASLPTSYTYGTGIASLTDGAKSGYSFGGWFDNPSCTGSAVTSIGTTATGDKTFYAKWTAVVSNTLTVQTDGHGSITTPSGGTTSYTIGTPVSIVAADGDGYTFKNWTVESGTATIASSTSKSTTVTVTAGTSATVQANYTEVKSTVTVNANQTSMGSLKFGETSKSWGTTASVGVTTTQNITATANSGYVFDRWVLSGGAASSSSSTLTNTTITLKANGSGDAGTAKAVFGKTYYYRGDKNSWGTDLMTRDEGGYYAYYQTSGTHTFQCTPVDDSWDVVYYTCDNSYGNITLSEVDNGYGGTKVSCPESGSHYICILYPGTAVNDGANPLIFASTTLPDLAPETTYATTFYAGDHGAINAKGTAIAKNGNSSVNIGATARTLTATPESGYSFDKWVTTGSVTVTDPYSESTTVSASAAGGTVTATYLANTGWYMHGVIDGTTDWCGESYWPHRWPIDRPYRGVSGVYYRRISSIEKDGYFGIHDGSSKYSGDATGSDFVYDGAFHDLVVNASKCLQAKSAFSNKWVVINTASSPKKIWIQSAETCHTVSISNDGNGTKGTVVLKTDNHGNLATYQYTNGETINIEIDTAAHYSIASVTLGSTPVTMTHSSGTKYTGTATMPNNDVTLTVTYTPWYTIHYELVPAAGGKTAPWANTSGNINDKTITSDATYVISGTTVYLYAATQSDGYTYYGWYSVNNPGKEDTSKRLGTSQEYSTSITTSGKEFYAIYFENDYTVTVNAGTGGKVNSLSSTTITGHKDTKADLPTATADPGYYFVNWTTTAGTLTNSTSATTGKINGLTSTATVTANFAPIWTIAGLGGDWNTNKLPLATMYVYDAVNYAYLDIDTLRPNTDYEFKAIQRSQGDPEWWTAEVAANREVNYGNSKTRLDMMSGGTDNNFYMHTAGAGTYTFDINLDDSKHPIKVHFPTSYTVTFGSAHGTVTATVEDASAITSGQYAAEGKDITFTQTPATGYEFNGWYDAESGGSAISCMASDNVYDDIAGNISVYAQYDPKEYTVTLTNSGTGYGSGGQANLTATYDAAFPSITLPTAAQGYGFMGYWSAANGEGTQFTNASGVLLANITDYSDESGHWKYDASDLVLYAYYKKSEITAVVLNHDIFEPVDAGEGWVIANPTIAPTPAGTTKICWELLYDNDNPVPAGHEAQAYTEEDTKPNQVRFSITGLAAGGYKIKATLRTGDDCSGGTLLSEREVSFTIASGYTVTIQYKDTEGNTIAPSTTSPGKATDWTAVSAPTIVGYNFSTWVPGDGITLESSATTNSNRFKATFNGTLTAQYTKKGIIYFKNTLGWSDVYVNFMSGDYWDTSKGSGNGNTYHSRNNRMTLMPGTTDVYYFEYSGTTTAYVSFTSASQTADNFWAEGGVNVVFPTRPDASNTDRESEGFGYNAGTPMFVPLSGQSGVEKNNINGGKAYYFNKGYWVDYNPITHNTGYTLEIYNHANDDGSRAILKTVKFYENGDGALEATVDLDAATTYAVKFLRDNNMRYTNVDGANLTDGTSLKFEFNADNWAARTLVSTAAGSYVFKIRCNSDGYLYVTATYPAAANDFQILYNDNAEWSLGSAHSATWIHPSRIIRARENGVDTISFFVAKDNSPILKARKVNSINASTGAITWGSLNIKEAETQSLSVDSSAVYNFKVTQGATAGDIASIEYIGPYTGNYYIRSNALNSNWDNYTTDGDHRMTYSSFSESNANSFGEKYSHYKAKWCPRNTNIAFCIANDYSPCITDTLKQDVDNPYGNTDINGTLNNDGDAGHSMLIWTATALTSALCGTARPIKSAVRMSVLRPLQMRNS